MVWFQNGFVTVGGGGGGVVLVGTLDRVGN